LQVDAVRNDRKARHPGRIKSSLVLSVRDILPIEIYSADLPHR
jgi:hypothetical protein